MASDAGHLELADLVDLGRYPLDDLAGSDRPVGHRRGPGPAGGHRGGRAPGFPRPRRGGHPGGGRRELGPPGPPLRGRGDGLPRVPRLRPARPTIPGFISRPYAVAAVGYDVIPRTSPLRRLYEWDAMLELIAAILDRGPLYRYGDPFGALNLSVMGDGDQLQWHFDQTDFVVSLAIQSAEGGGDFEVAPHPVGHRRVLPGRRRRPRVETTPGVVTLAMTPGTLLDLRGAPLAPPGQPDQRRDPAPRRPPGLRHEAGNDGQRPPAHGPLRPDGPLCPILPTPGPRRSGRLRRSRRPRRRGDPDRRSLRGGRAPGRPSEYRPRPEGGPVETGLGHLRWPCPGRATSPSCASARPGLAVKPFTLFVNKAPLTGPKHERLTWGAAQAGVASGVLWAVADGVYPRARSTICCSSPLSG